MAGHSHAANVRHKKNAQNAKKTKIFTKLSNLIYIAAKQGGDPEFNPQLRFAIKKAQEASVPKDKIENAIKRATGNGAEDQMDEIRYNANLGKFSFIIEALTDNKNRTASEIRALLSKRNASLVETGSVEFAFDNLGLIKYEKSTKEEDQMMEIALNAGCSDFESDDDFYYIYTNKNDLHKVSQGLMAHLSDPESISLIWKPNVLMDVEDVDAEKLQIILESLEDQQDIQDVFVNFLI